MLKTIHSKIKSVFLVTSRLQTTSSLHGLNGKLFEKVAKTSTRGETFEVLNPLSNKLICRVAEQGVADVQEALQKAHQAFPVWKRLPAKERCGLLLRLHQLIMQNQQELAEIITLENGKPLQEALDEVAYGADYVQWFAEEGRRVYGDVVQPASNDRRCIVVKEPIGVCAMITPWNFPNAMVTRKMAPALVVGCPVVLKPSEETPLSALAIAQLVKETGFPDGVFSVLTCSREASARVGEALCSSPLVRKLSFTGSTAVGKVLMTHASKNVTKLSLELGGNAAFVVFPSADLRLAVKALVANKFRNSGQTCICTNRVFVHEEVHDRFVSMLAEAMATSLRFGDGFLPSSTQGPLINAAAVEKVMTHLTDAVSKGAVLVQGGKRRSWQEGEREGLEGASCYVEPVLLTHVSTDSLCFREESFGPFLPISKFSDERQVVEMANNSEAGLAGYFFSKDHDQIWRVAEALEVGVIGANVASMGLVQMPFGGVKESGYGREGSKYGLDDYLVVKSINFGVNFF